MFLLLLMGLGAASVKAQVRIGGNGAPNAAAVLDLNATDDATPAGNKGALALPRVSLASTTAQLNGVTPITGMLVYNTNASITGNSGTGLYFWDGSAWIALGSVVSHDSYVLRLCLDTTVTVSYPSSPGAQLTETWVTLNPPLSPDAICTTEHAIFSYNGVNVIYIAGTPGTGPYTLRVRCFLPVLTP